MRKILITGASKGIGHFLLKRFVSEGATVYGTYNQTAPNDDLAEQYSRVDVRNDESVITWVQQCVNADDEIVLINCAANNYNALGRKANVEKWGELIDINLVGTFRVINACLPLMYQKKWGRIINFSSVVAQKGMAGTSAYAASKAALWGMSKSLAVENAAHNITINTLNLGYMAEGMTISAVPVELHQEILNQIPEHKFGEVENIYNAIVFLINSPYTTGTTIDINGGLY